MTASAPGLHAGLGQQVLEAYAAPPGVADQVTADGVGHAVQRHPHLAALPVEQVGVGQRDLAFDHPVDPKRPVLRSDRRRAERGVDPVEAAHRRLPRLDAGQPHLGTGRDRRGGDAGQLQGLPRGVDRTSVPPGVPADRTDDEGAQPDARGQQQEPPLRVGVTVGLRPQLSGEHGQAAEPREQPDHDGQEPADRCAELRLVRDQPDHPEDHEAADRGARPRPGQHPEGREEQQQDEEDPGDQQRLVLVADQPDRLLREVPGGQADDELGHLGDGVPPQAQQRRGQQTGRQTRHTGEDAGERPEPSRPHALIVARA